MSRTLLAHHVADLRASGLTDETIAAVGFRSLTAAEVATVVGMDAGPGYAIPYPGCTHSDGTPYVRVRLDKAFRTKDGHSARYLTKPGEAPRLYVPPGMPENWREDVTVHLGATEGEKKSCAATQAGFFTLAVAGVWAWLTNGKPLPDFDEIAWTGREVVVVGDSDLRQNAQAADGLRRLCRGLISRKARAKLLFLPADGQAKVGADDYIVKHGTEAFGKVLTEASHPDPAMPVLQWEGDARPAEQAAPVLQSWSLPDFLARDLPEPQDVVAGLIGTGEFGWWYGPPGTAKSFIGEELCRCVVSGRKFLGRFECERGPAALLDLESPPNRLQVRLRDLDLGDPLPPDAERLEIITQESGFSLQSAAHQEALLRLLHEIQPRLVVIDTFGATTVGLDLLRIEVVGPLLAYLRRLNIELGTSIVLIAHVPKWTDRRPQLAALYGSQDLGRAADFAYAACDLPNTDDHTFRVAATKTRWREEGADFVFSLGAGASGGVILTSGGQGLATILLDLTSEGDDWTPSKEVYREATAAGYDPRSIRRALRQLISTSKMEARGSTNRREFRRLQTPSEDAE